MQNTDKQPRPGRNWRSEQPGWSGFKGGLVRRPWYKNKSWLAQKLAHGGLIMEPGIPFARTGSWVALKKMAA